MKHRIASFLIAFALVMSPVSRAMAGPPGDWTEFTNHTVYNFANHGYVRTADGVLHVA
ncbi:MAG: hypothetical protein QOK47_441, partial [Actinomycetota bacterium]|nr:hypothetical protein [Actinomycetota bacterium]